MMPMTPSGTRTRWKCSAFGRVHSASTVPIGSGLNAARHRFDPRGIELQAIQCRAPESGGGCSTHVAFVGREDPGLVQPQRRGHGMQGPVALLAARDRQHALRRDRFAAELLHGLRNGFVGGHVSTRSSR
jgi:hypothetical protein